LRNIGNTGKRLAEFINFLRIDQGTNLKDVHIVGHSLGAHIAGAAGRFYKELFKGTLGRSKTYLNFIMMFEIGSIRLNELNRIAFSFDTIIHILRVSVEGFPLSFS